MSEAGGREIATVREFHELHAAMRARREEIDISMEELDQRTGLQSGYSAKLLAVKPSKSLGPVSFGAMLGALGLVIVLVEDKTATEKTARTAPKRNKARGYNTHRARIALQNPDVVEAFRMFGSRGAKASNTNKTVEQKRRIGRRAAEVKWRKKKWWVKRVGKVKALPAASG